MSKVLAKALSRDITTTIMHLVRHPRMGRLQTADGVRRIVTRKYSYRIYYIIDDAADELVIANDLHGSRSTDYSGVSCCDPTIKV